MKLPISNRLLACASFVRPGSRVADIGTDHGYLGIHLLQQGIAAHVIAADLRESPLQNAIAKDLTLTDDCSAAELAGYTVRLTAGSEENLKITVPTDLILAEAILTRREQQ